MLLHNIALILLLIGATPATAASVVVAGDNGGRIGDYLSRRDAYDADGVLIRVEGVCASACTLYLTAKNVCATDGALFIFHDVTVDGKPDYVHTIWQVNRYPMWVRKWLGSHGGLWGQRLQMPEWVFRSHVKDCP